MTDLFEIELVNPYSNDYNTVLDEAQRDQNEQARPELANHVEEYDFTGKTIIPFCSHGGGRFGQSLTAISKMAADKWDDRIGQDIALVKKERHNGWE